VVYLCRICGLSMSYLWFIYVIFVVYLCHICGLSMLYLWFIYVIFVVYLCHMCGPTKILVNRFIYVIFVVDLCHICGPTKILVNRFIYAIFVGLLWSKTAITYSRPSLWKFVPHIITLSPFNSVQRTIVICMYLFLI
jgi:hypothetical protein